MRSEAEHGGKVIAIRGAVIDVAFMPTALPPIDDALSITAEQGCTVMAEVQAHLDEHTVRAIALQATTGLRRGDVARPIGGPVRVPVGEAVLGRLLDVTGRIGDQGGALPGTCRCGRSTAPPPPLGTKPVHRPLRHRHQGD